MSKEEAEKKAEDSTRDMKVALLADVVETFRKKLDSVKKNAKVVIESADEDTQATASLIKEELVEATTSLDRGPYGRIGMLPLEEKPSGKFETLLPSMTC